jgi:hypothetical protein
MDKAEAAEYLGISTRSVDRHSSPNYRGIKPLTRCKVGGLVRFDPADLDAFVVRFLNPARNQTRGLSVGQ